MADSHAKPHAEGPTSGGKPSLLGRLLAPLAALRARPIRSLLIAGPATVAVIGLAVTFYLIGFSRQEEKGTLEQALARLAAGQTDEARQIAAELKAAPHQTFANLGGAFYVLGAVMAQDAAAHENPHEQQTLFLIAARYLEESRIRGFPAEHEGEGLVLLGTALHHGGRFEASIPILKEAAIRRPSSRNEVQYLLADSFLHLEPPNLDQAAAHCRRLLAERHLTPPQRELALLMHGRIALAQGRFEEGRTAIAKVPSSSPRNVEAVLLGAWLLAAEAKSGQEDGPAPDDIRRSLTGVISMLDSLEKKQGLDRSLKVQIQLLGGLCRERLQDVAAALESYQRLRKSHFASAESVAAGIFAADIQQKNGKSAEALALYKQALAEAGPREAYRNDWLRLPEFEQRLVAAIEQFLATKDFARAEELARALPPLFPEDLSYQWRAKAEHDWASHLLAEAKSQGGVDAEASRLEAREHLRTAGSHFEQLARLRIATRTYLEHLTASADDYLTGQGYSQAARMYRLILREKPKLGQPEALTGLGEALLSTGDIDGALAALALCREGYPKHPSTYQARYLSALGCQEQGKLVEARQLLRDNLYNFSLTPASSEWRDSLFLLGKIAFREGLEHETRSRQAGIDQANPETKKAGLKELELAGEQFQEAIRILSEAAERYPQAPQMIEARYLLAESHRQAAKWPRKRLDVVTIEASRGELTQQMHQDLQAAAAQYGKLIEILSTEGQHETALERRILRNSYFGRADALFDLGKFEEALAAYSAATNRSQHEPESLEAYLQIAACYRRLNRQAEARGTLAQARVVLSRIKSDADFTKTTPYRREEWDQLLTWLSAL